ncbi:hypothetical protein K5X82_11790 [Halosquirtibacter xylanolyticus]|uniref:hypothetical protein n=1 Tax=Halosquirtibacter xylanolyticus TaxID=3374599 RepID=UPI00374A104E|nr:hypothetical protein K5X82_11790 [Prolixibacteraceae bacterium]
MNKTKLLLDVLAGISYSLIIVGLFRSIQLWSPHKWTLITGMTIQIGIVIANLLYSFKIKRTPFTRIMKLSLFWLTIGVLCLKMSTLEYVKVRYREYPRFVKAYELYYKDKTNGYKKSYAIKVWENEVLSDDYNI